MVQTLWETVWRFLKKLKIELSSSPISGYITKGDKITILKRYLHSLVQCRIIYNSQDMETTEVSTD